MELNLQKVRGSMQGTTYHSFRRADDVEMRTGERVVGEKAGNPGIQQSTSRFRELDEFQDAGFQRTFPHLREESMVIHI